jgi:nucleotide-binding universal stress UspA family protein
MSEHPVIACYRGLDSAEAVALGASLATILGEPLVIVHAYRYEPAGLSARPLPAPDNARRAHAAKETLRRARAFAGPGVEIRERIVPSAGVSDALVDLAREVDACLLTVGRDTEGRVTRALIPRAPCPVAVAPVSIPLPPAGPIRRIGVAYDGSPTARLALVVATRLAGAAGARVVLLAAGPTLEHAASALHIARLSTDLDGDVESRALAGNPSSALADAGKDLDLLLCGSRGRGRPLAAILGSVSADLVSHTPCPVIVVPPAVEACASAPLGIASAGGAAS